MHSPALDVPVVRLDDVHVEIDGHAALRGVSATADRGRIVAIVGANGSGKSTLVSVAAGLRLPTSGTATITPGARIAFVPQNTADSARLPLTVTDLVAMGRWRGRGAFRPLRRVDRERIGAAIDAVGLTSLAKRPLGALSGGQRQRAFVGQALAQDADLLVLDEPMSGLDEASRSAVAAAVRTVASQGAAVLAVTHDVAELGDVDGVITLADGRIETRTSRRDTGASHMDARS